MSDATTQNTSTTSGSTRPQSGQATSEFVQEMSRLGENLCALLKSYWESEERKSLERELTKGLEAFTSSVNDTLQQLKQDEKLSKAKESVKGAWQTVHGPQLMAEARAGALDTLRAINDQLARAAARKPAQEVTPDTAPSDESK